MRRTQKLVLWFLVLSMLVVSAEAKKPKQRKFKKMRYYLQHAGTGALNFASDDVLNPGTGVFVVMAWVKTTQSSHCIIVGKDVGITSSGYSLYILPSGLPIFLVYEGAPLLTATHTSVVNDGEWHHVVGVRDSSNNITLYCDGSAGTSVSAGSKDLDSSESLDTSSDVGSFAHSTGAIDDIRFYKGVALEAYQIANIYNSGFGVRVKENGFSKITSDGFYASCDDGSGTVVTGRKLTAGVWSDHDGAFASGDLTWKAGGIPLRSVQLSSDYAENTHYINRSSKAIQFEFWGREPCQIKTFKVLSPQLLGDR